jgi:hypothetical protein
MKQSKKCHVCKRLLLPSDFASHRLLEPEERYCEFCRKKKGINSMEELLQYIHASAEMVE